MKVYVVFVSLRLHIFLCLFVLKVRIEDLRLLLVFKNLCLKLPFWPVRVKTKTCPPRKEELPVFMPTGHRFYFLFTHSAKLFDFKNESTRVKWHPELKKGLTKLQCKPAFQRYLDTFLFLQCKTVAWSVAEIHVPVRLLLKVEPSQYCNTPSWNIHQELFLTAQLIF